MKGTCPVLIGCALWTMNCAAVTHSDFAETRLAGLEAAIEGAIRRGDIPGAVLHVECQGHVYARAYGHRALEPIREPMTLDTIFDLASLTKVVATTPLVMRRVERGQISLDAPVSRYLPEFRGQGKETITVRQLLTHSSGMAPGIPAAEFVPKDLEEVLSWICRCQPLAVPGSRIIYSDLNYHLLGEVIRRVSGESLDQLARREIWEPLGMTETGWRPAASLRSRIAPTELVEGEVLRGVVHDPTSRRVGGLTAHAGLFGTAADLAKFARVLLKGGEPLLQSGSLAAMTTTQSPPGLEPPRGLGWEIRPAFDRTVDAPPPGTHLAYGHTGWTGTSIWIDPPRQLFVILLTNRNHPGGGDAKPLRRQVAELATEAARPIWEVRTGIDVLVEQGFSSLAGRRVGLITNHTGISREGVPTIDLLAKAPGVKLAALFSPEHGIRGDLDQEKIASGVDRRTGLPIHSLYGETRQPLSAQLAGLDALVFDIQDAGCRFYTYVSTMGLAMEAAARHKLAFVVLDRVNPIGGEVMEGPVQIAEKRFTSFHPVPIRHGLTAGELARMFVAERGLELDLTVVPLRNWCRALTFEETGLRWVNPSPNLRNLTQATLYPGVGFLEFLNLSVGRGTEAPFEQVGAPWLDGEGLAAAFREARISGLRTEPVTFVPASSVFVGETCHGVRFTVTDRHALCTMDVGLVIGRHLAAHHAREAKVADKLDFLLSHPATAASIRRGDSLEEIRSLWEPELEAFAKRRDRFLLYPP
jgi:uncharacterized protein YbbC (DUF1343 family)/CubicO group peptidase (beta-lactamase class C family)